MANDANRPRRTLVGSWVGRAVLIGTLALALIAGSAPDYLHWRAEQLAADRAWSAVDWEARHLAAGLSLVFAQASAPPDPVATGAELDALFQSGQADLAQPNVARLLAAAVTSELRASGVPTIGGVVFPPVAFTIGQPPFVLVLSPRSEIRLAETVLLDECISADSAEALENAVERLNVSALVEQTGGIATYPTLIAPETGPVRALQTIAHEWTHTALFFTPLGRAYGASPELAAINETAADLVGQEIAARVMASVGEQPRTPGVGTADRTLTDSLRRIRGNVDRLLALGAVDDAEAYMEQERLALQAQGYTIRRLNQAYFAFRGSYAEGPAASTEIPDALRALRMQSSSLGEFIARLGSVTSLSQLKQLAST